MPFGINSAPEVWQQRMHQLIEGLTGIEVIADDFLVCRYGDNKEEALASHDTNLHKFLQCARARGLRLNIDKVKLRLSSVPFIGHLLTDQGLAPDPDKVAAIAKMPTPRNPKSLQEFLGMMQYLSKFLPWLSTITEPLRQLLHQDAEWKWLQEHDNAVTTLKGLISTAPVLRYFDCTKQISLQCDASESGLGYAILQPITFGTRVLTPTDRKYAQIEKEMLAIVGGCEKFDQYIYGQRVIVETDHKPLVSIYKKTIHNTPKRLQRMLLRLQGYDLEITYKKGKEMYLADTLSRAYPKDSEPHSIPLSEFCHSIEALDLTEHLAISRERLQSIQEAIAKDPGLKVLMQVVQQGWPHSKSQVPVEAQPYFTSHDELSVQDGLVFKGQRIIIPAALRRETIRKLHSSHMGVESCLRRAREVFYWPLMSAEIKDFISCCSVCNTLRPAQCHEPLKVP